MDYRDPTWSLSHALADDDVLQTLAKRPMQEENARALASASSKLDTSASRKSGDELVAAGFSYLGTRTALPSLLPTVVDVFIDRDSSTYVTIRRRRTLMPLSRFYIMTHFDDGTCLETVARENPIVPSGGGLTERGGHDDLARDVADHFDAVRERVGKGARILPVRDLQGVDALSRFFISHVITRELANTIANRRRTQINIVIMFVAIFVMLIYAIVRGR